MKYHCVHCFPVYFPWSDAHLLLSCEISLYILDASPFSDRWFANIFSHSAHSKALIKPCWVFGCSKLYFYHNIIVTVKFSQLYTNDKFPDLKLLKPVKRSGHTCHHFIIFKFSVTIGEVLKIHHFNECAIDKNMQCHLSLESLIFDFYTLQMEKVEADLTRSKSLREKQSKEFLWQLEDAKQRYEQQVRRPEALGLPCTRLCHTPPL